MADGYLCLLKLTQMSGQDYVNPETMAENLVWMEKVQVHQPAWLFISLFLLVGIFAWIRIYYGNILVQTILASTNFQVTSRMFKDNSLLQKQLDNVLYVFYLLSAGFLIYVVENRFRLYPYELSGMKLYLFNLALLAGLLLARVVLINLAGFLFNRIRIFREYLYNVFIFNKLLGVAVLPLLLFVVYTAGTLREVFLWTTLVMASAIYLLRIIRGIVFSFKKDVSIFYMFLYLCALELVPLGLLYRWLEGIL